MKADSSGEVSVLPLFRLCCVWGYAGTGEEQFGAVYGKNYVLSILRTL